MFTLFVIMKFNFYSKIKLLLTYMHYGYIMYSYLSSEVYLFDKDA